MPQNGVAAGTAASGQLHGSLGRRHVTENGATGAHSVLEQMQARRSAARVDTAEPPGAAIEALLEAATWAPNHYRTAPWRFVVLSGAARERLGEVLARSQARRLEVSELSEADRLASLEKERAKPLRAPFVIAVACVPTRAGKVEEIEEICAVAAGVQNMLLAAQAQGLGAMWRTGAPARDPDVKRFLGLPDDAHIIAFVYVGYPLLFSQHVRERDAAGHTTWMDS
jgi:nitroreductase